MAPSSTRHLCSVTTLTDQQYYLMTTELCSGGELDEINIALTDGESAWTGRVTAEDLERFRRRIHMDDYADMVTQTRQALTRDAAANIHFVYELTRSGDMATLTWKKHIATEDIKFQLGSTTLQEKGDPAPVICEIFQHAITSLSTLRQDIKSLHSDNQRLVAERASALKKLDKYVTAKEDLEQDLYSKFVVVLNDKKAKLRDLRDENAALQAGASSVSQTVNSGAVAGSSRHRGDIEGAESGDETDTSAGQSAPRAKVKREYDSEYETDDDEKPTVSQPIKRVKVKPEVTAKVKDTSSDSLLLDAGDDDDGSPVTGRRRRQGAGANRRQTPSKPAIPKVPTSDKKTTPTGRQRPGRASLRKSSSVHSKSSDNLDVDEMMDDI